MKSFFRRRWLWAVACAIVLAQAVAAVLILTAGAVAATVAGQRGASFMYDLEQPVPALSRVVPVLDTPGPRLSHRVVLVIVDGLRYDVSLDMPYLGELRARGIAADASSQYPTFSRPNYVNLLTGVPPAASGVRTNQHPTTVLLDTLMTRHELVREMGGAGRRLVEHSYALDVVSRRLVELLGEVRARPSSRTAHSAA